MRENDHIYRRDLSPFVIHWCKSKAKFYEIIDTRTISPHASIYTFENKVICFTETPIDCLIDFGSKSKCNSKFWNGWSPFGFLLEKKHFHESYNGLPVIYSPGSSLDQFKKINQDWRLVPLNTRFKDNNSDLPYEDRYSNYVWQREWRTQQEIPITDSDLKLILPNLTEIEGFKSTHLSQYHEECNCNCNYEHTLIKGEDLLNEDKWESIESTCVDEAEFPYVIINLELEDSQ